MHIVLVIPGPLETLTGGYIYDRAVVEQLRERGHEVRVVELEAALPHTGERGDDALGAALGALPDGELVVIDGLAAGAHPAPLHTHATRLQLVLLIHHPLALETGLSAVERQRFFESERHAIAAARFVICTSTHTERVLCRDYGLSAECVGVARPGVTPADALPARPPLQAPWQLLCVATLTPRKGHLTLLEALLPLSDLSWSLRCIGSAQRDPAEAQRISDFVERHGLDQRVELLGEIAHQDLHQAYASAHLFVLASHYEGYGMVYAEALARGVPVIGTAGGATADTVPDGAGVLVLPGDVEGLSAALLQFMTQPSFRVELSEAARSAQAKVIRWSDTAAAFEDHLTRAARSAAP